jgi:excisionase family DNA binding protein
MQTDPNVLAVGMAEAARRLGLSARTVATLVLRRELPSRKVGRRRIIPVDALEAFVRADNKKVDRKERETILRGVTAAAWGDVCLQNEGPRLAVESNLGPRELDRHHQI